MQLQTKTKLAEAKIFHKRQRVLTIGAHADDAEYLAGGTLAKLAQEGSEIYVLIATDGSKGSTDPKTNQKKLAATRKREATAAAKVFKAKKVFWLGFVDGELVNSKDLRKKIVAVIREVKPDIVITFDPLTKLLNHPDHREVGEAALDSVYPAARDNLHFPELRKYGLKPHKVKEVFLFHSDTPNVQVDIRKFIDKKVESIAAHKSQFGDIKEIHNKLVREGANEYYRWLKMPL